MDGERQVRLLSDALQREPQGTLLERVVTASAAMLEVSGVAAALMSDAGGGGVVTTTDDVARGLVDLDFQLGVGPCSDAFNGSAEVAVPDLRTNGTERWPTYGIGALELGAHALFALPARVGAIRVGVVLAHRDHVGPMSPDLLADARVFAEVCSTLMVDHQAGLDSDSLLAVGWPNRAVIHQATGMLATQLNLGLSSALARLRAYAFAEERTLEDVSKAVVERRLRIDE